MLHYLLGVNPMGLVYLTRMEAFGAEKSVGEFYHSWFGHGSEWDQNPPPGYLPGGPNKAYTGNLAEIKGVPPQKAFAEFNGGASNSWEVTENGYRVRFRRSEGADLRMVRIQWSTDLEQWEVLEWNGLDDAPGPGPEVVVGRIHLPIDADASEVFIRFALSDEF